MIAVPVNADTHPGSMLGLCPPYVALDEKGGAYKANEGQVWLWGLWQSFWDRVERYKLDLNAEVWSVFNGDSADRNWHPSFQIIPGSPFTLVKNIAVAVHKRPAEISDEMFFTRGTAAHAGKSGWLEEWLADDLGATRDEEAGTASWWYVPMQVEGLLCHFYHRPETRGWLPYTEDQAVSRMSFIVRDRCHEMGWPVPDVAVFSHVHYYADSGRAKKPRVLYTPSWQLPTAWIHTIGRGMFPRPVGGLILLIDGTNLEIDDSQIHRPAGKRIWRKNLQKSS